MIALHELRRWRRCLVHPNCEDHPWIEITNPGERCDWVTKESPYYQLDWVTEEDI